MSHQFIRVKKRQLKEYLSCPICGELLREAMTICECLHTFCRECITQKLDEEETNSCPICDVSLGCSPMEKLRPDNNLQDVRNKLFPVKRKKMKVAESLPLASVPARRKERSLSSIVISTAPVTAQGSQSNRKGVARRSIPSKGVASKLNSGKTTETAQIQSGKLDSQDRLKKQRNSGTEPESEMIEEDDKQNISLAEYARQRSGKSASWGGLACLAEAANRTEDFEQKPLINFSSVKTEFSDKQRTIKSATSGKRRAPGSINLAKRKELAKANHLSSPKGVRKSQASCSQNFPLSKKRKAISGSFESGPVNYERRNYPVWFALLASDKQCADSALPQIQKYYLCIKDGNVPVSYVKKYLVKKLNLKNEYEVEITCCGQPIVPSLSLYSLVEFWIQYAASSDRLPAVLNTDPEGQDSKPDATRQGPSAEEFMMVLIYGRKPSRG